MKTNATCCGLCVPSCAEGALQIVNGKAKVVADMFCDGLGACLGECPNDALHVIERVADDFDEKAVEEHLKTSRRGPWGSSSGPWTRGRGLPFVPGYRPFPFQLPAAGEPAGVPCRQPLGLDPLAGTNPPGSPTAPF